MRPSHAMPSPRRAVLATVAIVAVLVLPAPVLAVAPAPVHQNYSVSYDDVVCGIPVHVTSVGQWTNTDLTDRDGNFVLWRGTFTQIETLTAPNGASVIVHESNQLTSPAGLIDEQAGTITYVDTFRGVSRQVRLPDGRVLMLDVGSLSWAITFDIATGEFVSIELRSVYGPHPDLDSGFALFCEVVTEVLG